MPMLSFTVFKLSGVRLCFPLLLVIALLSMMDWVVTISTNNHDLTIVLPYILLSVTAVLSQPVNQGKTGIIAILMLGSYYIIQNHLQSPLAQGTNRLEYALLTSLVNLNLLLVLLIPERRLFSRVVFLLLIFIAGQVAVSIQILELFKNTDLTWLWENYLYAQSNQSPLPVVIKVFSVVATTISAMVMLRRNLNSDQAVFICLLLSGVTFSLFQFNYISSSFFNLAACLLLLNLLFCSHELAFEDPLTKIPSRRGLETEMKHLGNQYTIAMLDIDHFKIFNDTYGHDTGDNVLKLVASIMKSIRGNAKVFRYGGEEFTILFKGKETQECLEYLDELRDKIAHYELFVRDRAERPKDDTEGVKQRISKNESIPINITVSIGVADNLGQSNPEDVIKAADNALYRAKEAGRNQVKY